MSVKFARATEFHRELKDRVAAYFESTEKPPRDLPGMYAKSAIILVWFSASYALLVFAAGTWWIAIGLALSLGLAAAAIGMDIQHDGSHGGYSNSKLVNGVAAASLDLVGGSSYLWRWKHNVLHHSFTNIDGADDDINIGPLGRLSPEQPRYSFHRFQHIYMWPLYGFVALKWQLFDDFKELIRGKVGPRVIPRPSGMQLAIFIGGKIALVLMAFVIPALFHPFWLVVVFYCSIAVTIGIVLGVVFQMAHCVEEADFPVPAESSNRIEDEWAVHQVSTTVDFARHNKLLTWYIGGLNYQIEHHLFPKICHLHYPKLSPIVESVCGKFGVKYEANATIRSAMASHVRWLRRMGRPEGEAGALPNAV
jgi:linoleoyl-CoA desaturase